MQLCSSGQGGFGRGGAPLRVWAESRLYVQTRSHTYRSRPGGSKTKRQRQIQNTGAGSVIEKAGCTAVVPATIGSAAKLYCPLLLTREFSAVNPGMFIAVTSYV